jgi:transcriptional regulator with XRE-family HTH domain
MTTAPSEGAQPHPRTPTAPPRTSTVLRILLGTQLRRLRESRRITLEEAGRAIRASHSKISRMELGRVSMRGRDVADLLTLYGVADEGERAAMLTLVSQANVPGWWHDYGDVLPSWFEAYIGLEQAATGIRNYEVQFVPGLLQTEDYARALVQVAPDEVTEDAIEQRVKVRMERQQVITGPDPLSVWAIIDEAALCRPAGGWEVMRAQMQRLIEVARLPSVTLQLIPFDIGAHPGAGRGPFTILQFPDEADRDAVYVDNFAGELYVEEIVEVGSFHEGFRHLVAAALSPAATMTFIAERLAST